MKKQTKRMTDENKATNAKLKALESEAREMLTHSVCPKCGEAVVLHDTGNGDNTTPWRPNRGTKVSYQHTYYCACPSFHWVGPTSGDPVEAAKEWKKVME